MCPLIYYVFHTSKKHIHFLILIFIFLILLSNPLKAQNENNIKNRIWGDLYVTHIFNEHFRINPYLSYRGLAGDTGWKQYVFNPDFIFTWNDIIYLRGGVFFQYTDDHNKKLFEVRTVQGIIVFFPRIKGFFLQHSLKLEERFIYKIGEDSSNYSTRLRYYLQAFIPLNNHYIKDHTLYVWPGMEIFMTLTGNNPERFINQSWIHIGLGYKFSKHYRFEFCYMQQELRNDYKSDFKTTDRMFKLVNRITIF